MDNKNFVAIAQINMIAGNLEYNSNKIIENIKKAESLGAELIVFPAKTLLGYGMSDFVNRFEFIVEQEKKWLEKIAEHTKNITALIGFTEKKSEEYIAIIKDGKINYYSMQDSDIISSKLVYAGDEFLIKMDSIPSKTNSFEYRVKNISQLAKKYELPVVEVNQVGAIDNNSYAGLSMVCNSNGEITAILKDFEEDLLCINPYNKIPLKLLQNKIQEEFSLDYEWDLERTYKSLVQGIRDYFQKCGLKRAVLGLSGGLDSTVCAVLLVDALGKENVYGVSMPSKLTSQESKTDAEDLAKNLGIGFYEASIKPMVDTLNNCLDDIFKQVQKSWDCRYKKSFTQDNIQARSRAMYLWSISNEFESCIPIATSDKSESYMGYATVNGDMSGGFAPIADVTKTKLFALARWMNENRTQKNDIPEAILLKKPGAELAIDEKTGKTLNAEDALMPYEFMDEIIWRIENKHDSYEQLLESEFIYEKKFKISKEQKIEWLDKFFRRMSTAIYKWSILPPSVIVDFETINKSKYYQPITSGSVNYKK